MECGIPESEIYFPETILAETFRNSGISEFRSHALLTAMKCYVYIQAQWPSTCSGP